MEFFHPRLWSRIPQLRLPHTKYQQDSPRLISLDHENFTVHVLARTTQDVSSNFFEFRQYSDHHPGLSISSNEHNNCHDTTSLPRIPPNSDQDTLTFPHERSDPLMKVTKRGQALKRRSSVQNLREAAVMWESKTI